jgi:hypothetical protein
MSLAPLSSIELGRRVQTILARCRDLIGIIGNPYRPELHYMRGPGPKWRAKHRLANLGSL